MGCVFVNHESSRNIVVCHFVQKKEDFEVCAMDEHTIARCIPQAQICILHDRYSTKIKNFSFFFILY